MMRAVRKLWLGVTLIVAASAVLLLTEHERPRVSRAGDGAEGPTSPGRVRSLALFQHVSQPTIEEGAKGVLDALAAHGYRDGASVKLSRFNAEGDTATSSTIARELVGDDYDLIVTLSTPSLQAVAGANRETRATHVFGMVTDPIASGVGIDKDDPRKHPPYMTGIGTMQPVAEAFRLLRRLAPKLKRVGVAWNPSEANSEACTRVARTVCRELGIELLEANVENSAGVREAVASVIGRGAEAVWIGGDTTVLAALDAVMGPARSGHVPVFTNIPGSAGRGPLFDLGADYYRVGLAIGEIASTVLDGTSPADLPIRYEVPPEFWINEVTVRELPEGWSIPADVKAKADVLVGADGPKRVKTREAPKPAAPKVVKPARTWKIGVGLYTESTVAEESLTGLRQGLKDLGLVDSRDFVLNVRTAQGDVATLNAVFEEFNGGDTDIVVSFTTPGLQAALSKVTTKPLIFAVVLDPFAAGAGKSDTEHKPGLTGTYLAIPFDEMVKTIRQVVPQARKVGTLFTPGETNSIVARDRLLAACRREGMELTSVAVNSATEVGEAALALARSDIDVFCQVSDSLTNSAFPTIGQAAITAGVPLFTFGSGQMKLGPVISVSSDYAENGRVAAEILAEVMQGADPSRMPFRASKRVHRAVNLDVARRGHLIIPRSFFDQADEVLPAGSK